jgi:hypothetical protein
MPQETSPAQGFNREFGPRPQVIPETTIIIVSNLTRWSKILLTLRPPFP